MNQPEIPSPCQAIIKTSATWLQGPDIIQDAASEGPVLGRGWIGWPPFRALEPFHRALELIQGLRPLTAGASPWIYVAGHPGVVTKIELGTLLEDGATWYLSTDNV